MVNYERWIETTPKIALGDAVQYLNSNQALRVVGIGGSLTVESRPRRSDTIQTEGGMG